MLRAMAVALAFAVLGSAPGSAQAPPTPLTPLSLPAAIDAMIARNLSVVAARYNVDLFRAQRVAAALKPDPTVVVSATQLTVPRVLTNPRYAGVALAPNSVLDSQYSVDVEKLIERGGKRDLRVAQADIETTVAEHQLANELREQTFQLKQAFLDGLLARENVRVLRQNLQDFDRSQQVVASQVDEGYTAGVDLRRLGIELVDLRGNVSAAEIDYVQRVRDVLNLIGDGERATASSAGAAAGVALNELDGDLNVTPVDLDLEGLRTSALAHRPDLKAAQATLDAADAGIQQANATRVRDFTLGTQYMRSGPDNAVGVAVGIPLTTKRRADAAIAQATALRMQAEARLRQARAQVMTDVEKAFVAYQLNRDRLRLFDARVLRQAAEVRTIEQVAYREGERGLLNFLDAQRAYNQTLVGYNQARHDVALSLSRLEWSIGTSVAYPGIPLARTPFEGERHD